MTDPEQASDPFEEAFLNAYPNPDRFGCPGDEILQGLAIKKLPIDHPARMHLGQCSPCWKEFRQYERQAAASLIAHRRYWALTIGIAACLVVGIFIAISFASRHSRSDQLSHAAPLQETADLWNEDIFRGSERSSQIQPLILPSAPVQLKVVLPRFSRQGDYDIAICRERNSESSVVKGSATATQLDGKQIVTVLLDITRVAKGTYWLSTRHDQDDASYYFPIKIY